MEEKLAWRWHSKGTSQPCHAFDNMRQLRTLVGKSSLEQEVRRLKGEEDFFF